MLADAGSFDNTLEKLQFTGALICLNDRFIKLRKQILNISIRMYEKTFHNFLCYAEHPFQHLKNSRESKLVI